jgi:hypothetical protein
VEQSIQVWHSSKGKPGDIETMQWGRGEAALIPEAARIISRTGSDVLGSEHADLEPNVAPRVVPNVAYFYWKMGWTARRIGNDLSGIMPWRFFNRGSPKTNDCWIAVGTIIC